MHDELGFLFMDAPKFIFGLFLLCLMVAPFVFLFWSAFRTTQKVNNDAKFARENPMTFPPLLVETICRAMAAAEGSDPEPTKYSPGWRAHVTQAQQFLAAHEALVNFHANENPEAPPQNLSGH